MEQKQKYKLQQGDIIRFGRITTRIKEIRINKNTNTNLNKSIDHNNSNNINNDINDINDKNDKITTERTNKKDEPKINLRFSTDLITDRNKYLKIKDIKKKEKMNLKISAINICQTSQKFVRNTKICRICYGEEDPITDIDNPLVQPCKCTGSLKYIHLNCLKHWLNTKSCTKVDFNNNYSIFLVRQVECEICKTKFPDFIKHKESLYEILDFKSEFENFFTLESLTIDKNNTRCIYVVNLDNNIKIKIGRGHDANLTLSDISVSRVHSIITIDNKNIYLEDNNSKFGTLILVQCHSLQLIENLPLYIQIGRTFLECKIEIPQNIFSCCGVSEKPNYNFYYLQNENRKQLDLLNMFTIKSEIDFSDEYESEIDEKEKDFEKIKFIDNQNNQINNRYEDNTLDIENINNSKLRISKEENDNEIGINLLSNKKSKSLFNNVEESKNDNMEMNEGKSNNIIDKSESIILESEN